MKTIAIMIAAFANCVVIHGQQSSTSTTGMTGPHIVKNEIDIKGEPAAVWEALTNPWLTKKYFYGSMVYSDWQPGHSIVFKRKFLWKKIEMKGEIIQIEPGKLLQYTLHNSAGKNGTATTSTVTDVLTFENGITKVSITDDVGTGEGADKRYKRSVKGWNKILKGLKKTVEKDKNPNVSLIK